MRARGGDFAVWRTGPDVQGVVFAGCAPVGAVVQACRMYQARMTHYKALVTFPDGSILRLELYDIGAPTYAVGHKLFGGTVTEISTCEHLTSFAPGSTAQDTSVDGLPYI